MENKKDAPKDPEQSQEANEAADKQSEKNDDLIPAEIMEAIPAEDRGKFVSIIRQSIFSGAMRGGTSISSKITTEHITKLIDKSDTQDLRDREERKNKRNYNLLVLVIGLAFLGFLIVFLKEDKELLYKIIIAVISFIGGFGLGKTARKTEE